MRIAWILPARSAETHVGGLARELLSHLGRHTELQVFVEAGRESEEDAELEARPLTELRPREHDQVVYSIGNEPEHAFMLPMVRLLGGTVFLHDWALPDLAAAAFPRLARGGALARLVALREGGLAGLRACGSCGSARPALNRSVVRHADAFVVQSAWLAERVRRDRNAHTPVAVLPLGTERRWLAGDREEARRRRSLPGDRHYVVAVCGPRGAAQAALSFLGEKLIGARLLSFARGEAGLDALRAADVVLCLGGASAGAGAEGLSQALSLGRAIVVDDLPELSELPAQSVLRVPPADLHALARTLTELGGDEPRRAAMEQAVRHHVEERASWGLLAPTLVTALAAFPHARSARRPLVVAALRASARPRSSSA